MKTRQTSVIAILTVLVVTIAITPFENAFAEKTVSDKISSNFRGADFFHNVEGTVTHVTHDDGTQVLQFGDNFKSTPGPDIYVYLATDDRASDFVSLGKIQHNDGAQAYEIPVGTDLSKYDKVLIWCQAFGVLFGTADL